jgi:hypothetical protein
VIGGPLPPKANAAVLVPQPDNAYLAVFKSFNSVQLVPFQDSLFATFPVPGVEKPPNTNAAV